MTSGRIFGAVRELDPNQAQAAGMNSAVGAVRFAQNALLRDFIQALEAGEQRSWSSISLHSRWREIRDVEAPWYTEVSKEAFQYGAERLAKSLKAWSDSRKGKRSGASVRFPRFRRRGRNDSVAYTSAQLRTSELLLVPRVGEVRLKEPLTLLPGQRVSAVIVRPLGGKWLATFRIREDDWDAPTKKTGDRVVGVDLGLSRLATLSDGVVIANPKFIRSDAARLRRASKSFSRKRPGSTNRRKAAQRLSCVHYRIACRRSDYIHKFTTDLVKSHDEIVIEDLAVAAMGRGLHLGKSVHDAALAEIRRQLAYKCEWYGTTLTVVDRWFPSSKLCSECGAVNRDLRLADRKWVCAVCGVIHDRDLNAAINLAASSAVAACGDVSSGQRFAVAETVSMKQELDIPENGVAGTCLLVTAPSVDL